MYLYILVCSLIEFFFLGRYLGLFGDHIVLAVLFRYTQVLWRSYLDILKKYLPDKTGEKAGWNFGKAPSILHKVREIVLWGNTDNSLCQSPEVRMYLYVLIQHGMY